MGGYSLCKNENRKSRILTVIWVEIFPHSMMGLLLIPLPLGKVANTIMWGFDEESTARWMECAMSGIPENFSGKLLEIPVGTGVLTMPLYQSIPQADITCMDYSAEMMRNARYRAGSDGNSQHPFFAGRCGGICPFQMKLLIL